MTRRGRPRAAVTYSETIAATLSLYELQFIEAAMEQDGCVERGARSSWLRAHALQAARAGDDAAVIYDACIKRRSERVVAKVTPEEKRLIIGAAARAGLAESTWLRRIFLRDSRRLVAEAT